MEKELITALLEVLGESGVNLSDGASVPLLWPRPIAVVSPGNVDEVVAVVRAAEAVRVAVVPVGGGTQISTGYPPAAGRPYLLLSTARLNRILDHQPEDMTVTVEPGVTLSDLQEHLAPRRQHLGIDAPRPDRATLGGIVSANTTGFWRPLFGTPRDLLIGVKAVMTGGEVVKGGGRVVKNVAGYDVCKLFTGAWGTLGIITELTFKIHPLPETERTLAWNVSDLATAVRIGLEWHYAQLAPAFLIATNYLEGRRCLVVGLRGQADRVAWQAEEFARRAEASGLLFAPFEVSQDALEVMHYALDGALDHSSSVRISCLPMEAEELVRRLHEVSGVWLSVQCTAGVLNVSAPGGAEFVRQVQTFASPEANLLWTRHDPDTVPFDTINVWGEQRGDFFLHRRLKETLDPKSTFSPGRFYGRL